MGTHLRVLNESYLMSTIMTASAAALEGFIDLAVDRLTFYDENLRKLKSFFWPVGVQLMQILCT